jgi:hypothetical protein
MALAPRHAPGRAEPSGSGDPPARACTQLGPATWHRPHAADPPLAAPRSCDGGPPWVSVPVPLAMGPEALMGPLPSGSWDTELHGHTNAAIHGPLPRKPERRKCWREVPTPARPASNTGSERGVAPRAAGQGVQVPTAALRHEQAGHCDVLLAAPPWRKWVRCRRRAATPLHVFFAQPLASGT